MISLEMDGLLPHEQTPHLERHLTGCDVCRDFRADLLLGARMLQATGAEPSDAFEWKLQLKLNQALQEAAGARVPWDEAPGRFSFGWVRGFALSSVAGLAATLALAVWVLPQGLNAIGGGDEPARTELVQVDDSAVGASAGDADRRSLTPTASTRLTTLPGNPAGASGLGARTVNQARVFDMDPQGAKDIWPGTMRSRSLATLQGEVAWLRDQVRQVRSENDSLRALLKDGSMGYLERNETRRE